MNFFGFTLVTMVTFFISQFAMSQVIGIILFKLPKKEFECLIGLFIWMAVLIGLYFAITKWFNIYFNVYLVVSILSFIIVLFNIKNLKSEC